MFRINFLDAGNNLQNVICEHFKLGRDEYGYEFMVTEDEYTWYAYNTVEESDVGKEIFDVWAKMYSRSFSCSNRTFCCYKINGGAQYRNFKIMKIEELSQKESDDIYALSHKKVKEQKIADIRKSVGEYLEEERKKVEEEKQIEECAIRDMNKKINHLLKFLMLPWRKK